MFASERSHTLGDNPIRKLVPLSIAAENQGVEVLKLNIGQPDILTPPEALDVLNAYKPTVLKYGRAKGKDTLRMSIATHYNNHVASAISLDDIFVTTGASEGILLSFFAALDAGVEVIIPQPCYANYIGYAKMAGVSISALDCSIEDGFDLPSIEDFEACITADTRAILLCNPNNPTGQFYSEDDLRAMSALVKKHKLYLIVDEVYRPFVYDDKFYSALSLTDIKDHVIVIDSISKTFSACGARIGCIVSKNKPFLNAVQSYAQLRLCPPDIAQEIAIACYQSYDKYFPSVKAEYRKRRDLAFERLSKINGITTYKPRAAFYNIIELPISDADHFCKWLLTDFRMNGQTLMLAPANGFYEDRSKGKNQVRLAFVLNCHKLNQAFDLLQTALAEYEDITV